MNNEEWHAGQYETEVKIADEPIGKPIILRRFHSKFRPDITSFPTKKELREFYQESVEAMLWKDEIRLVKELDVRIDKEARTFDIFATGQARAGAHLFEKPTTINKLITPSESRGDSE
jgi:hypothetical protein